MPPLFSVIRSAALYGVRVSRIQPPSVLLQSISKKGIHSAASEGFNKSSSYHTSRPAVSRKAVEFILDHAYLSQTLTDGEISPRVVELGAGTGLFTAELLKGLKDKYKVISSPVIINEPHPEMRKKLLETIRGVDHLSCEENTNIEVVDGSAAVIGGVEVPEFVLKDGEFDIVVACQAFHW